MSKFTEELNEFSAAVAKLPPDQKARVYAAMKAAIGPVKKTRQIAGGQVAESRDVDWQIITDAVPPDLRQDARQIQRSFNDETKKRGQLWADESGHYVVTNRLLPQPTPAELLITDEVLDVIVAKMQARADARLVQQQERPQFRPSSSSPTGPFGGPPPAGQGPGGA
jgi:hypothetical protein